MDRRSFLSTASATVAGLALAGCAGDTGDANGTPTGTETATETELVETTTEAGGTETPTETATETEGTETETGTGTGNQTGNQTDTEGGYNVDDFEGELGAGGDDNLEIVDHEVYRTGDDVGVTGSVTNTGDAAYENVQVDVTLNHGDTSIGEFDTTSQEQINDLAPGETWQFRVSFEDALEDEELTGAVTYTITASGTQADGAGNQTGTGNQTGNATGNASDA